jgi:hypothetical protein
LLLCAGFEFVGLLGFELNINDLIHGVGICRVAINELCLSLACSLLSRIFVWAIVSRAVRGGAPRPKKTAPKGG